MLRLGFALALFSTQVTAADFRVASFGESCARVQELEQARGSRQIPWSRQGPEFVAFGGKEFGRDVSILYLCPKGSLFTGNYFFSNQSLEAAVETLRSVYEQLISSNGAPFLDNTPWQTDADPRAVEKDPRRYMVTWRTARTRVTISVMPEDESEAAWHVFVVVGQNRS